MSTHSNRLAGETSPYLLQHAHNPVDWYPWGDEAFERARREDKPVFLSIGYSACHWCHVMERESFENEELAALLNEHFISIKVDREERPDVDSIYMQAVQMMSGQGGWPMSMFLTPEGAPFYGGTYFPPEDRYGRPGFGSVITQLATAYRERRDEITRASEEMRSVLNASVSSDGTVLGRDDLQAIVAQLGKSFDRTNGGFGGAPKFPPSMTAEFLLQFAASQDETSVQEMVEFTLRKMASGGIYDQVGGGFHRYSVDAHWLVPHFEKMLYDNALLTRLYVHAWQQSGDPFFARVARETVGFIAREMTSPEGGFYSTLDADSEGEEGKFYVWSRSEVLELLGAEEGRAFCALYDISESGNWEGSNILNMPRELSRVALDLGISEEALSDIAARGKCKLYGAREKRVRPGRDEKILAGWNGWMLAALSEAALAFDSADYFSLVRKNADFLCDRMIRDRRLHRSFKDGQLKIPGLLEDLAGVSWGLLAAFEATGERRYLDVARELADQILERFADSAGGGFFDTPDDHETLIARPKDLMDNAVPSGNSTAAEVFFKLARYFDESKYEKAATECVQIAASLARRYPSAFGFLLCAANYPLLGAKEIVLTGSAAEREPFRVALGKSFTPRRVVVTGEQSDLPLLQGRDASRAAAWVCEHFRCLEPADSPELLLAQLSGRPLTDSGS